MTGALAIRENQTEWNEVQLAALVQLGIDKAPRGDQLVFLHVCQRMGLDPFNKEIYMIGRKDDEAPSGTKWTIQIGIDGFRSKSEQHPQFAGIGPREWCGPDGKWVEVWLADEPPSAARFTVYRKDQEQPIREVALFKEYVQKNRYQKPTKRWETAPADQVGKCAEAKARRTAFPRQLGGVYAHEELEHLENPPPVHPPTIEATAEHRTDRPAEPDWDAELESRHGDPSGLKQLLDLARGIRRNDGALLNRISLAWQEAKAAAAAAEQAPAPPAPGADAPQSPPPRAAPKPKPVSKARMDRLVTLLAQRGLTTAEHRLELVSRVLQRPVPDFLDLTAAEVETVIGRLAELGDQALTDTPAEQPTETGDQP